MSTDKSLDALDVTRAVERVEVERCSGCGGDLPTLALWERYAPDETGAPDCSGAIDADTGRCAAWRDDGPWWTEDEEAPR